MNDMNFLHIFRIFSNLHRFDQQMKLYNQWVIIHSTLNWKMQTQNKKLSCLAISDTHEELGVLRDLAEKEEGDVFIHAGDFTYYGQDQYFTQFCNIVSKMKFRHKIVISGNHEIALDDTYINPRKKEKYLAEFPCKLSKSQILDMLKKSGCIYLEHQAVTIQGRRLFGSPFTPYYCGSAFQYAKQYDDAIWSQIPGDLDVLITHGPPFKILDKNVKGVLCGSPCLQKYSKLRKPKFHIFGHIHEARGHIKINETNYINIAYSPCKFYI